MTATLADAVAHMALVRDEYDRTKADHALADGCDHCTLGASPDRITGWDFIKGEFLCPRCVYAARRQINPGIVTVCGKGHDLTRDGATFQRSDSGDRIRLGCRQCRTDRSTKSQAKRRAAKVTAR